MICLHSFDITCKCKIENHWMRNIQNHLYIKWKRASTSTENMVAMTTRSNLTSLYIHIYLWKKSYTFMSLCTAMKKLLPEHCKPTPSPRVFVGFSNFYVPSSLIYPTSEKWWFLPWIYLLWRNGTFWLLNTDTFDMLNPSKDFHS